MMKFTIKKVVVYLFLLTMVIIALFPFFFMLVSSTNTNAEILAIPPKLTIGTNFIQNFSNLNNKINLGRVAFNSLFISVIFTASAILLHSMAGYALAKYNFKGRQIIFVIIMLTMMLPPQVVYIARFLLMTKLEWANTYQAVILPALANAFGIFLMRQNMLSLPDALLEASRLDGCGEFGTFWGIVLPNMKPAMSALGIYMFMNSWNDFMWPLIILSTSDMHTFPLALSILNGSHWRKDYGLIMLGAAIAILPIMVIFLLFQKYFIAGVMGGGIKE